MGPGTYTGALAVNNLTIRSSDGAAQTIIEQSIKGEIIHLETAAVLDGFTINALTYSTSIVRISIVEGTEGASAINNVINGAVIKIGRGCSNITVQGNIINSGNIYITSGESDILIKGNKVSNYGSAGINIQPSSSNPNSDVTVEDNEVTNCGVGGIHQLQGFTSGLTIKGNKVFNLPLGGWGGINVVDGSDIKIENNEVHNVAGCGIIVGGQTVTVRYNEVYDNMAGIKTETTGVVVNYNNIYGNTAYGLKNSDDTETVDATNNWWGDASGPTHTSNPGGAGDAVSDNVIFEPWSEESH
ncbi:hypothetical protein ES708_26398 [subsurface metagenome]